MKYLEVGKVLGETIITCYEGMHAFNLSFIFSFLSFLSNAQSCSSFLLDLREIVRYLYRQTQSEPVRLATVMLTTGCSTFCDAK
jgi:hypothetical protein